MQDIVIIGASGFGKEVAYHIKSNNTHNKEYNIVGFIDDNEELSGKEIIYGLKVLGTVNELATGKIICQNVCIAIANNSIRNSVFKTLENNSFLFPNIFHAGRKYDESNSFGIGNIIGEEVSFTCDISMGNFNIFTGTCGTGHDVKIGDFNLFGPRSIIAGGVTIGNGNNFHMNSGVIQNLTIGNNNTLNLFSCLFKRIKDDGVYFGVPAMKQKF